MTGRSATVITDTPARMMTTRFQIGTKPWRMKALRDDPFVPHPTTGSLAGPVDTLNRRGTPMRQIKGAAIKRATPTCGGKPPRCETRETRDGRSAPRAASGVGCR